jgi:serine/threonine protein kinase
MLETGSQLGPYRLLRRIGAGGMAEVFLAQRIGAEGFARTVAVKTILALGAEEEGVGLFLDEARVASYLEHAAIVQTVDLGFENDTLFIVMEYVPGPALSRMIRDLKKSNRFLSAPVVAYIGARVASALDYAWNRAAAPDGKYLRLVHRDISPQNILITRTGNVKLTDFGVARASVQTHKTRTGQVRGKAAYMAPEQVRAGTLDGRTDIFALALVLYEALTGVRAFQRKTDIMSMRAILTDEMPPIRDANPNVPDELIAVLKKATSKKPDERYQSAAELGDALQKTYRMHSEAGIEAEIVSVINDLFGEEQFGSGESGVEAWQPTIAAQAAQGEGSHPTPHRISANRLSPKIAAMLQQQQSAPSLETPFQPFDEGQDIDLESLVAQKPQIMGVTQARAPTSSFAPDPVAFSEIVPQGATHAGGYPVYATPSNATGMSPMSNPSAQGQKSRALLWGAGAFAGAMMLALIVLVLAPSRTEQKAPLEAQKENAPMVVVRESAGPVRVTTEHESGIAAATESDTAKMVVPETDEKRVRREAPRKETPREARREERVVEPEVKPVEAPVEKSDRNAFVLRAMAAKKKTEEGSDLEKELTKVLNDVLGGREVSKGDWEIVKRAESTP